ncbi:rhomboid family intramembrane serine protease [Halonotius sp. GCM10025705]|uniref:rhomboid family intramembrane serine protease n=1 Tax=Halonotius sp. GCM10025705 TaxID=3252678 RepID=UPI00361F5001
MANCDECGADENMPYQCKRCGHTFCADHRLPENHDCPGLDDWNDPDGVFDSGFDDSVETSGGTSTTQGVLNKLRSVGGPLGYFRGNAAYTLLGLMWITFLLQQLVGVFVGPRAYVSLFTLSTTNPEYLWTWLTSIFSHGGLYHLAANSIVLFFFGPLVERYTGSKKFVALFLAAGALAGLGHVGISLIMGETSRVLGASGAVFAIMGVLTVLKPDLKVLLFFVIPLPLYILTFGFALISVLFFINPGAAGSAGMGNVAHFAHLVGLVIGLWYGRQLKGEVQVPNQLQFGGGPGGPGGPGRGRF